MAGRDPAICRSPCPGLTRPSTSSHRHCSANQDVDGRVKPGQGEICWAKSAEIMGGWLNFTGTLYRSADQSVIDSVVGYWFPVGRTPLSHFGRMNVSERKKSG